VERERPQIRGQTVSDWHWRASIPRTGKSQSNLILSRRFLQRENRLLIPAELFSHELQAHG